MSQSDVDTVEKTSYVGLATESAVHRHFYKKCFFNHFTPRGRSIRFSGIFESCEFNKADFRFCIFAGSFYNCSFRGTNWAEAVMSGAKFYNCDFSASNLVSAGNLGSARFNEHCKNLNLPKTRSLIPMKAGELRISEILEDRSTVKLGPPISLRNVVKLKDFVGPRRGMIDNDPGSVTGNKIVGPINYLTGEWWDEDTSPGIYITVDRRAFLFCSDAEEYKGNCGSE